MPTTSQLKEKPTRLKRCPFCFGRADVMEFGWAQYGWVITCRDCHVMTGHWSSAKEAARAWNRRTTRQR